MWAYRRMDAWLLGPSKDHYRCNVYYILETHAYRISGSTELFPQHCQLPNLCPIEHLKALKAELATKTTKAVSTKGGETLLKNHRTHLDNFLSPPLTEPEQRVYSTPPPAPLQRETDNPTIMWARNPTAKRRPLTTRIVHRRQTHNNTPGGVPTITCKTVDIIPNNTELLWPPQRSPCTSRPTNIKPAVTFTPVPQR